MDEALVCQIREGQRLVAEPLHQLEVFLEHGDGQPGAVHSLLALMLDEAVIHDDRHLPAQGLDHGILIDGLESAHHLLQVILLPDPLVQAVRHLLAGQ
ncbi:hypothetical protein D3C85_1604380 [compost metagenome]